MELVESDRCMHPSINFLLLLLLLLRKVRKKVVSNFDVERKVKVYLFTRIRDCHELAFSHLDPMLPTGTPGSSHTTAFPSLRYMATLRGLDLMEFLPFGATTQLLLHPLRFLVELRLCPISLLDTTSSIADHRTHAQPQDAITSIYTSTEIISYFPAVTNLPHRWLTQTHLNLPMPHLRLLPPIEPGFRR
jgi:hypothetical protein